MTIQQYIKSQPSERQKLLSEIHDIIISKDKTVTAVVEPMMRQDMIVYKAGIFKYGLASPKNYMSLHVLPIYGSKVLHEKYQKLLSKASFQKGCINFKNEEEMPLEVVKQLIADCSKIDLKKMKEEYFKSRKA